MYTFINFHQVPPKLTIANRMVLRIPNLHNYINNRVNYRIQQYYCLDLFENTNNCIKFIYLLRFNELGQYFNR